MRFVYFKGFKDTLWHWELMAGSKCVARSSRGYKRRASARGAITNIMGGARLAKVEELKR